MKANKKSREINEHAVSAVIGVILMVAITVAIAATVYVYVSGMLGGTKTNTPNVVCTTHASSNKIIVTAADGDISWSDITMSKDNNVAIVWLYYSGGTSGVNITSGTITQNTDMIAGDYIHINNTNLGKVKITLRYNPTNSLLGTWTIYV